MEDGNGHEGVVDECQQSGIVLNTGISSRDCWWGRSRRSGGRWYCLGGRRRCLRKRGNSHIGQKESGDQGLDIQHGLTLTHH